MTTELKIWIGRRVGSAWTTVVDCGDRLLIPVEAAEVTLRGWAEALGDEGVGEWRLAGGIETDDCPGYVFDSTTSLDAVRATLHERADWFRGHVERLQAERDDVRRSFAALAPDEVEVMAGGGR